MHRQFYKHIQTPPKALIIIKGANHYSMTNQDNPRDPSRPTLKQPQAIATIARWSALLLRAHLLNDSVAFNRVYKRGTAHDRATTVTSEPPQSIRSQP
ncbi:MAG: hypothetical protein J0L70_06920 [Leptolyngbya sp. UWPOB_LEPTO1]|uniref:hypothetical protein n=1 Tax=Leptolyngbya sp. UWPOB_LEPTO1 TaxID=2815653 RepID=UPI001ACD93DD|nr:hypothetical protein [Leptolyngbya sp. UWPOB_LEPTO1]MBN8560235.1 hypothetical protein [Leptolyngbya sp. UWPOB_LEPTO1]